MSTNPFAVGGTLGSFGAPSGFGSIIPGGAGSFASSGGAAAAGGAAGAGAGMGGGGGWLMPSLGIALKLLGMFGGKKAQNVLAMHNAFGPSGLVGQMFGSNNPFAQNTGDKDKDKVIGGSNDINSAMKMGAGGFLGQNPFGIGTGIIVPDMFKQE